MVLGERKPKKKKKKENFFIYFYEKNRDEWQEKKINGSKIKFYNRTKNASIIFKGIKINYWGNQNHTIYILG